MKILIFNFEYPPLGGGGGIATAKIAGELVKKHDVHVITTEPGSGLGGRFRKEEDNGTVNVHRVKVWGRKSIATASLLSMMVYVVKGWWKGRGMIRTEKFDVINAQFVLPSGLPAAVLAGRYKIPFVLSFIGGDVYDPTKGISPHRHWFLRWCIRRISQRAAVCTAISNDTRRRVIELHKVKKRIEVVHLGINRRGETGRSRQELGLPEEGKIFVAIGRVIHRKGDDVLLRALAKMEQRVSLVMIGEGPVMDKLKALAADLGIEDRVMWLGYVDEQTKMDVLNVADGYVSAAEHEGFGIVFLEAMQYGLPIVATWEGGQTDFLRQERNALLVEPGREESLAKAMDRIVEDEELVRNMSENNKSDVRRFYWPEVAEKFERVLEEAKEL